MHHHVRKQTLHVAVDSESLAFTVRARLQELNRTALLPVIERVFNELSAADRHIQIDRLDVDLGTMSVGDLDWEVTARFEQQLRDAVRKAIDRVERQPSREGRVRPEEHAHLDVVERYLRTGTLPFWVPAGTFRLEEWIARLSATSRERLAQLFTRLRSDAGVLERLTHQVGNESVQRLFQQVDRTDDTWVAELYRTDRQAFLALLHDMGPRPIVERFLPRLGRAALEELVRQLVPEDADQIVRDVTELASMPQVLRHMDSSHVLRHLWLMMVDTRLRRHDQPYEGTTFVREVLAATAQTNGQAADDVLTSLGEDWTARGDAEPQVSRVAPGPQFRRYDLVEAVQYYVRHGVLPWTILLLRPDLTVSDALDALPDVPLGSLQILLSDLAPEERLRAWHRVVRDLPLERLTRFIAALAAERGLPAPRTLLQMSMQTDTPDRTLVHAQTIDRLLEGDTARTSDAVASGAATDDVGTSGREAHRIKSVLSSRAHDVAAAVGAHSPTSVSLLAMLIELDVEEARHFLRALSRAGIRPAALVDEVPSTGTIDTIQKLLAPDAASSLTFLREAVAALPPADRPADADFYAVIVTEVLEQYVEPRSGAAFFQAVLQRLTGASRARPAHEDSATVSPAASRTIAEVLAPVFSKVIEGEESRERLERAAPSPQKQGLPEWIRRLGVAPDPVGTGPDLGLVPDPAGTGRGLGVLPQGTGTVLLSADALGHSLLQAIDDAPEAVHVVLVEHIDDQAIRERWARELSEPALVRMAYVLEPRLHRILIDAAEVLFFAWLRASPDQGSWQTRRQAFWSFVLGFLGDTRVSGRSLDDLVARFVEAFGSGERSKPPSGAEPYTQPSQAIEKLLAAAAERASAVGSAALRAILDRDRAALIRAAAPSRGEDRPARAGERTRLAFSMDLERGEAIAAGSEPIYIANAGLVLTNPFLPQWFAAQELLEKTESGRTQLIPGQISRAVHLLQWLTDGSAGAPEPLLCLNKLLCGVPLETPIARSIEPTAHELEVCQLMLRSMLANWTIINTTSIEGLQETFLQRDGRLERTTEGWRLTVQRKTVDVLLDQIPWSISTIAHAWMPEPIFVTW